MRVRAGIALLLCAAAAAVFAVTETGRWLRPREAERPPQELYAPFAAKADEARYVLKNEGAFVAVYEGGRAREPLRVTPIELRCLRSVDQAMIRAGLPVASQRELLQLLEDLGP